MAQTLIREFRPEDAHAFRQLNLAWIEELFSVEDSDRAQLDDPQRSIIEAGGEILVGELDGKVVATGAILLPHMIPPGGRTWLELVKMATDPAAQGHGLGGAVLDALINRARQANASAIRLETNSDLGAAIRLYERKGFVRLSDDKLWPTPIERCNFQMVLEL